jgi:hypothetical protein
MFLVELFSEMRENILTPLSFFDNILAYHEERQGRYEMSAV